MIDLNWHTLRMTASAHARTALTWALEWKCHEFLGKGRCFKGSWHLSTCTYTFQSYKSVFQVNCEKACALVQFDRPHGFWLTYSVQYTCSYECNYFSSSVIRSSLIFKCTAFFNYSLVDIQIILYFLFFINVFPMY